MTSAPKSLHILICSTPVEIPRLRTRPTQTKEWGKFPNWGGGQGLSNGDRIWREVVMCLVCGNGVAIVHAPLSQPSWGTCNRIRSGRKSSLATIGFDQGGGERSLATISFDRRRVKAPWRQSAPIGERVQFPLDNRVGHCGGTGSLSTLGLGTGWLQVPSRHSGWAPGGYRFPLDTRVGHRVGTGSLSTLGFENFSYVK